MKKTLIVVESPNKIKKISSFLGKNYIIRASFGHVTNLNVNKKHHLGIDLENNYTPRYKIIEDKKDKVQTIIDATTLVDQIYLATDLDREGEAIAWHLNNYLESSGKPIKRISFNEITESAVKKAIKNPREIDQNLFKAQQARRVLDRIVGFLASDYLRNSLKDNFSAGRVQSIAALMIVDRELEIEAFEPKEYWNINVNLYKDDKLNNFIVKYNDKITNKNDAEEIKQSLQSSDFIIKQINKKEKNRDPNPPLTTSKLQQAASNRYNFGVEKTMRLAQSLYESGLITYMRTDSVRISPEAIKEVRKYMDENNIDKSTDLNNYKTKKDAQDAHEAIRPTDVYRVPKNMFLGDDSKKIYELIWERFVASQMKPAIYDTVSVVVESSNGHVLNATGKTLKYEGWLSIASDLKNNDNKTLPELNKNDNLNLIQIKSEQKFTQPPSRYGEATLVNELEKKGIGRPSTYASIISTIKKRNYVELKGKVYHATDVGKKVMKKLSKHFSFMDYKYTADLEKKLDEIANGKSNYVEVLDNFYIPFKNEYKRAEEFDSPDYGIPCPICNKRTILKHGSFGFYMACVDRPDCKGSLSVDLVDDKPIVKENSRELVEELNCPICNAGMYLNNAGRFGPYYYCENAPRCKGKRKYLYGKKCPECNHELYVHFYNEHIELACMGYFEKHQCKYKEELSKEESINWVNPTYIRNQTFKKRKSSIQKALKARVKGKSKK